MLVGRIGIFLTSLYSGRLLCHNQDYFILLYFHFDYLTKDKEKCLGSVHLVLTVIHSMFFTRLSVALGMSVQDKPKCDAFHTYCLIKKKISVSSGILCVPGVSGCQSHFVFLHEKLQASFKQIMLY